MIAIDIPQKPCQTSLHGRRQQLRRLRRRRAGRRVRSRRSGTASTTPGSRSRSPRSARPTTHRMGGYRKGFQSVCPGPIIGLKKVGFDATLDKARTLVTDVLTTLPGKQPHHRRVDRRRGHRGRVRRREVRRPPEGRLGHLRWASPTTSPSAGSRPTRTGSPRRPSRRRSTAGPAIPALIAAIKAKKMPAKLLYVPLHAVEQQEHQQVLPEPQLQVRGARGGSLSTRTHAGSASRSAASRSSTESTSTPPAAPSSHCSARTAPASRRS